MAIKKKLLLYTENYVYGGLERFLFDLLNDIDREKYEVSLLYNDSAAFDARFAHFVKQPVNRKSLRIHTVIPCFQWVEQQHYPRTLQVILKSLFVGLQYLFLLTNLVLLRKEFSKHQFDVLHIINGGYPGGVSCRAAVLASRLIGPTPIVMSVLSYPTRYLIWPLDRLVDSAVGRFVTMIITNSERARQAMHVSRKFPISKVCNIYTGVKTNTKDWAQEEQAIRRHFKIPSADKIVGMVAAFQPGKGHRILVDAIPMIGTRFKNVKYILVGDGKTREGIEELVQSRELTDNIVFAGYYSADNILAMMALFDVFVLPSLHEGFPYVILEAMSLAKPIVATSVAGIPEQLENGISGILIPPSDSKALADAVACLLANEDTARQMGEEARRRVEGRFSQRAMSAAFSMLYEELCT